MIGYKNKKIQPKKIGNKVVLNGNGDENGNENKKNDIEFIMNFFSDCNYDCNNKIILFAIKIIFYFSIRMRVIILKKYWKIGVIDFQGLQAHLSFAKVCKSSTFGFVMIK